MFCEGTRFTHEKHEESMIVARAKGLPELKHHLLPRTKGVCLLARGAQGRVHAIYDLNVGIADNGPHKPTFNSIRFGRQHKAEMYIRRIPMDQVPVDEKECAKFVYNFYKEKDDIYDVYARTGSFANVGGNVEKVTLPKNYYDLFIFLGWLALFQPPLVYYIYVFVSQSTLLSNALLFLGLFICEFSILLFTQLIRLR
jgi:lysophosphatidic acid acyltransferase/lysophosphatidylinositol acyltransferase